MDRPDWGDPASNLTDDVLWARTKAGDRSAMEAFWRRHYDFLLRSLRQRIRDTSDVTAEDVLQIAFVRVCTDAQKISTAAHASNWVLRVACNEMYNHQKSAARRRASTDFSDPDEGLAVDPSTISHRTPEDEAAEAERIALIREAIDTLPNLLNASELAMLNLLMEEELTHAEIAARLGRSGKAVASLLNRVKTKLNLNESEFKRLLAALSVVLAVGIIAPAAEGSAVGAKRVGRWLIMGAAVVAAGVLSAPLIINIGAQPPHPTSRRMTRSGQEAAQRMPGSVQSKVPRHDTHGLRGGSLANANLALDDGDSRSEASLAWTALSGLTFYATLPFGQEWPFYGTPTMSVFRDRTIRATARPSPGRDMPAFQCAGAYQGYDFFMRCHGGDTDVDQFYIGWLVPSLKVLRGNRWYVDTGRLISEGAFQMEEITSYWRRPLCHSPNQGGWWRDVRPADTIRRVCAQEHDAFLCDRPVAEVSVALEERDGRRIARTTVSADGAWNGQTALVLCNAPERVLAVCTDVACEFDLPVGSEGVMIVPRSGSHWALQDMHCFNWERRSAGASRMNDGERCM